MNHRLVARILGIILFVFTASMLTMLPFALWYGEGRSLIAIGESIAVGLVASGILYMVGYDQKNAPLLRRETLAVVGSTWIVAAALAAVPLYLGGMTRSYTDGYFEAMSGLTTTGSTILRDIESQPRALIFWRSFLQFLGGLGIVVFFVAVLPTLGVGGKALFRQEVPGPTPEGITPRIKDSALQLCYVYVTLNVVELLLLKFLGGMSWFDSLNHAMATMSTGGFSPSNTSIAGYGVAVEWIIILFMFLGGTNFALHLQFARGKWNAYWRSLEFRVYLFTVLGVGFLAALVLWITQSTAVSHPGGFNFRDGVFNTLTIMTTTGFGTVDFDQWPQGLKMLLLVLMFTGAMAGSTAGGLKLIRIIYLVKSAMHLLRKEVHPRVVNTLKVDGRPVSRGTGEETFGFFFIYVSVFVAATITLTFLMPDQSLLTSASAVIATLNNIGPGMEAVGPTMNFADQSALAKWLLSLCMVLGRLELYVVMVLFAPRFWFPK